MPPILPGALGPDARPILAGPRADPSPGPGPHIPRYVALPPSTVLDDLLSRGARKGGLKSSQANRVGPRRTLQAMHADGRPITISLQALRKDNTGAARLLAILKPTLPTKAAPVRVGFGACMLSGA